MNAQTEAVDTVACPFCGAAALEPCSSRKTGQLLVQVHRRRIVAAQAWLTDEQIQRTPVNNFAGGAS